MNAAPDTADGDGRASVSLAELIALRARAGRPGSPAAPSRAARAGQQSSRLYGRGMDYAESRAYQPGDDVRRLDWRLTARSGRLHTKLFEEEREARLLVLLDTHAGMRFGTRARFKSVQAARAAALAGWLAARAGERVGALAFGAQRRLLTPRPGMHGALALCGALAEWDRSPPTDEAAAVEPLSAALRRAARLANGASRVLLVSDGACCDEPSRPLLWELSRHARLGVLLVNDALEREPPPPGRYPLEHDGERREVELSGERRRRDFQRALGAGRLRLETMAQSLGLRWRGIDTAADPQPAVLALLGMAGRR